MVFTKKSKLRIQLLLMDIKPELQARIDEMTKLWPGREVLCELHRCENLMKRLEKTIEELTT